MPEAPPVLITRVPLSAPALLIHGGAGGRPAGEAESVALDALRAALQAGWEILSAGGSALDAVEAAVVSMEDGGVFNAGRGAVPTTAGEIETDAAVMGVVDAAGGRREVAGAICAATWPANPIRAARAVAMEGDALLIAGPGADAFAEAAGLPRRDPATLTGLPRTGEPTPMGAANGSPAVRPVSDAGTVGAVALDAEGRLAAATSTGGRRGQPPGRIGDSPIIGAGTWADQGRVAVSATGDGEAFVRAGFAHRIDLAGAAGVPLERAAEDALLECLRWGGTGGAIVLGADGTAVLLHDTPGMSHGWRHAGGEAAALVAGD